MKYTDLSVRARSTGALLVSLGLLLIASPAAHAAPGLPTAVHSKHVMWAAGQGYPSLQQASANNLIYHGGLVETVPAV